MRETKVNCWEFKRCGREPGGERVAELGTCPAATEISVDGANHGTNGGRACWVVAGTFCGGNVQGSFAKKFASCLLCDFYRQVVVDEGRDLKGARSLKQIWHGGDGAPETETDDLVAGLSDIFDVLVRVEAGDYAAKVDESVPNPILVSLARTVNMTTGTIGAAMENLQIANRDLAASRAEQQRLMGDLEQRVVEERELAAAALRESAAKEKALRELDQKLEIIERQRYAIQELSTPVLQLWNSVLAMPIIGVVDSRRSGEIMERLLSEITAKQSRFVILDITGVEIVDTKTADHFIKVIKAAELLGTRCILTGIRPAVAQTLVEIGVDLSSIITLRTLQDGLRECLRQMGQTAAA